MAELTLYTIEDNVGGDTLNLKELTEIADLTAEELQGIVDLRPGHAYELDAGAVVVTRIKPEPQRTPQQLRTLLALAREAVLERFGESVQCRHASSGVVYEFLRVAIDKDTLRAVAVYAVDGLTFTRPLDSFLNKFGPA